MTVRVNFALSLFKTLLLFFIAFVSVFVYIVNYFLYVANASAQLLLYRPFPVDDSVKPDAKKTVGNLDNLMSSLSEYNNKVCAISVIILCLISGLCFFDNDKVIACNMMPSQCKRSHEEKMEFSVCICH